MTKYAEVIFEPGSKSVVSYENESELKNFVREHHRRAVNGEPGAPQNQTERLDLDPNDFAVMPTLDRMKDRPAERINKVLLYDKHPADLYDSKVPSSTIQQLVEGMASDEGTVDHEQLIRALRDEASPVYPQDQGRHESIYKAESTGELDLSFLNANTPEGA